MRDNFNRLGRIFQVWAGDIKAAKSTATERDTPKVAPETKR